MAEDDDISSRSGAKVDKDSAPWIRNVASLVTIFVAFAGVCFTAYQLKLKSETDEQAAQLTKDAEWNKLEISRLQLKDQGDARAAQAEQHKQDNDLELSKHRADIQQQNDAALAATAKSERERLEAVINKVFSSKDETEGGLASLAVFVNRSPEMREIVEHAVLARLTSAQAFGQVELCFQLLEQAGPTAIDYVIQANRVARHEYDVAAPKTFGTAFRQELRKKAKSMDDLRAGDEERIRQTALSSFLGWSRLSRLYNQELAGRAELEISNRIMSDPDEGADLMKGKSEISLQETIIERSNGSLQRFFETWEGASRINMDLGGTYLIAFETRKAFNGKAVSLSFLNTYLDRSQVSRLMPFSRLFYTQNGCSGLIGIAKDATVRDGSLIDVRLPPKCEDSFTILEGTLH